MLELFEDPNFDDILMGDVMLPPQDQQQGVRGSLAGSGVGTTPASGQLPISALAPTTAPVLTRDVITDDSTLLADTSGKEKGHARRVMHNWAVRLMTVKVSKLDRPFSLFFYTSLVGSSGSHLHYSCS